MSLVDRFFTWVVVAAVVLGVGFMALLKPAHSQVVVRLCFPPASAVGNSCIDVTAANPLPVLATASISGFAPATTGTPISVTSSAGGVTGTLPAGSVVVASNVGTTNTAYCKLGASATTADQPVTPNGGWFAFTVGAATQLTCITSTSTTTVNMVGGAGLPTGTGGGGGGSGGGAITVADGADVTQGALADAACATDNGSCTIAALVKRNNQRLTTIVAGIPVTNAGTFAVQAAQSGTWNITNISGTVSLPTGAATAANQTTWQGATGSAVPANAVYNGVNVAGNTRGATGLALGSTFSQTIAIVDGSGNQVTTFGGSGGTASNFGSAFPSAGTAIGLTNGTNMVAWSATTNYGTAPAAIAVPAVNAFVTNAAANGAHDTANSSTVNIASDQAAVATKAASGAWASGSLASGAVVDITNMSVATGAAPPSKVIYLGANSSGATGGQLRGMINCDSHVFKHITTATDTVAVQGVTSQTVFVCGWRARAAGTATWYLENTASTNNNCSSTLTQISGVGTEATNTGEVLYSPFWGGFKNTSGNGLCINSTGTGGVDIDIWYTQF